MNKTSQFYWWSAVERSGVPVPKTVMVRVEDGPVSAESLLYDGEDSPPPVLKYTQAIKDACAKVGYPAFLKTDLISGKHSWRNTCFVESPEAVEGHLFPVTEAHALALMFEDDIEGWVVREMLNLAAPFTAFQGLPIGYERRYFVEDGEVVCHHPYWPEDALEWYGDVPPENWRVNLKAMSREGPLEVHLLTDMAERVGKEIRGAWSIDFACVPSPTFPGGWMLIDMAVAEQSWHPEHLGGDALAEPEGDREQ